MKMFTRNTAMKQGGFTLIELMITVAVLAIFLSIAAPSFTRLMERSRVTSATNNFIGVFQYARAEAVRNNKRVVVQNVGGWRNGIRVFLDADGNGAWAGTAAEKELRLEGAFKNMLITASNGAASVVFMPDGTTSLLSAGTNITFGLCSTVPDIDGRKVQVMASGVVRLEDATTCN
ncbi:MAG: GspH/FimT family pseudopilin [Pseudomonadales bacterium]|nr:GspH/FimT family pseudopilin [Pseudomonadales bacterium]